MEEKIWAKFHPLFGSDLKVGFETTFPKEVILNLNPLYEKSGFIHDSAKESVKRIYEPAVKVLGSCLDSNAAQVFFKPASLDDALFRRLVLTRKIDHRSGKPRQWMVVARRGEITHFGFDSWNSKNQRYLFLAYPGLEESFIPVYVKIQEKGGGTVYLEVWAWGENGKVVVQGRRVYEKDVPESLFKLTI